LIVPRLVVSRLVERRLRAQGVPFAYLGDTLGQPGHKADKTVEEGAGIMYVDIYRTFARGDARDFFGRRSVADPWRQRGARY